METEDAGNSAQQVDATHQNSPQPDNIDWKQLYERERARSSRLREQNAALRATVRAHIQDDRGNESSDDEMDDHELPGALWHDSDQVERCTECLFEVVGGVCQDPWCGKEHAYDEDGNDEADIGQGVFTWDSYVHADRFPQPRGSTPLLEGDSTQYYFLENWNGTPQMYESLMARGATRLMIVTFQMTFDEEEGIIAWADDEIYKQFSGPGMMNGDQWKIMLGRRIKLDVDDLDGSIFIEDLLEDAIVRRFPDNPTWETVRVKENSNVWVTRPIGKRPEDGGMVFEDSDEEAGQGPKELKGKQVSNEGPVNDRIGGSESPVLHFDDYEPSDVDPEDLPKIVEPLLTIANTPAGDSDDDSDYDKDHWVSPEPDGEEQSTSNPEESGEDLKSEAADDDVEMRSSDSDPVGSDWDSDDDLSDDDVDNLKRQAKEWFPIQ
ncbi:hypothetical protein FRC04_011278 [Tulasnella sp. 424]|nr:hypothetical protein FRC04_011278 [Tulasnella sp. 424]KAG8971817.1 hypothetical protein FRC05_010777 [Tulasnella sp. 425]